MDPSANPFASSEQLRTSRGHRFRHSARTIAHLVSKFERLDTHRRSDASFAKSTSCLIPARQVDECHVSDTRPADQSTPKRNGNMFPNASDASRNTLKLQRSQSLKARPSARFGPSVPNPRHKSVAERRMMFEMGNNDSEPVLPSNHSLRSLPSVQSINVSSSPVRLPKLIVLGAPKSREDAASDTSPISPLDLYMSQPRVETRHVQRSTDVSRSHFETPPEYAVYELEAPAKDGKEQESVLDTPRLSDPFGKALYTSPGKPRDTRGGLNIDSPALKRQSIIEKSPGHRSFRAKSPSLGGSRHPTWLENAQRMASSLSASASSRESIPELTRRHPKVYRPKPRKVQDPTSMEVDAAIAPVTLGSGSKISTLTRKFDMPKSSTTTSLPFIPRRRGRTNPIGASRYDPLSPSLSKSVTTTNLGDLDSSGNNNSQDDGLEVGNGAPKLPATRSRRGLDKKTSPLKEKIGLFESLGRRGGNGDEDSFVATSPTAATRKGRSRGMKGTIRRISASFRKSSSEWSNPSPRESFVPSGRQGLAEEPTGRNDEAMQPHSSHEDNGEETDPLSRQGQAYNVDGEGGSRVAPKMSNVGRWRRSSLGLHRHPRLPGAATNQAAQMPRRHIGRRIVSRSSGPFVSKAAHCSLEQPVPVRANELRRLISMCKSRMARQSSRGDSV